MTSLNPRNGKLSVARIDDFVPADCEKRKENQPRPPALDIDDKAPHPDRHSPEVRANHLDCARGDPFASRSAS